MYESEMNDLELTYVGALEDLDGELDGMKPVFLDVLERYTKLTRTKEKIYGKLLCLRAKRGIEDELEETSEVCDEE